MPQIIEGTPTATLVARPSIIPEAIYSYLVSVGGEAWFERVFDLPASGNPADAEPYNSDVETLIEFCGRLCYRSWDVGLNANVTKIRKDSAEYFRNILATGHGSILSHGMFTFVCHNVSRVFTHEQVRHGIGTAFSQESMRFVRLTEIPFWFPAWALEDQALVDRCLQILSEAEQHQMWMSEHFELDATVECPDCFGTGSKDGSLTVAGEHNPCEKCEGEGRVSKHPFAEKKAKTSFMRRFAPDGVATGIVVSANIRAIRHMIEMRTDPGAEEEIRLIYNMVGNAMIEECPLLFGDYTVTDDGDWQTKFRKV